MEQLGKLVIRSYIQFAAQHGKQIILATYQGLDKAEAEEKFTEFVTLNKHIDSKALDARWEVSERLYL